MDAFSIISDMVQEAQKHADDTSADRVLATEYYRGQMPDTPAEEGRSKVVSKDVRAHIKKVLPSIVRTILGNDEVVEYQPVGPEDEETAQQASDYINYVVLGESGARDAIYDAIHDALLLRNGIIKWWLEEKVEVRFSSHSGLTEMELAQLAGSDDVEVVESDQRQEDVEGNQIAVYDVRIKRHTTKRQARVAAVPRERFLIHPDAVSLQESLLVGEVTKMRRGELVAMGYDESLIRNMPMASGEDEEEVLRRDFMESADETSWANEEVDYYDLFVRIDLDGDGISELRHMCFAGQIREANELINEECDEVQYEDIAVMRQPHQWEGISLADDLMDIQRSKTVLTRQTLDNLYWQNNPQPIIQADAIKNIDAVVSPEFGKPIFVGPQSNPRDAVNFTKTPFVARESFAMLEKLDQDASDRTGITDASSGLAPDALQNVTAKASAMIEQGGVNQSEMMTRTIAEGLRFVFRGLLRLIIRHQDKPRTVRLRDKWVTFDPRHWNAGMDASVNTGLGAGTRERDMMVLSNVLGLQEKLIAAFGPDNPFVSAENLYNTLSRMVEAAGMKTPSLYFSEPDPEDVQRRMEAMRNQPNAEAAKAQVEAQIKQAEFQAKMALEDKKIQANIAKEKAQMDADLQVQTAQIEADSLKQSEKLQSDAILADQKIQFEREKLNRTLAQQAETAALDREIEMLKSGLYMDGSQIRSSTDDQHNDMMNVFAQALAALTDSAMAPKRVVYSENGDVSHLEPISGHSAPFQASGDASADALTALHNLSAAMNASKQTVYDDAGNPIRVEPKVN